MLWAGTVPFALLFFISAGALYFFPALLSFSFLPSTLSFAPRPSRNAGFVERIDPLALSQSWNSKSRAQERFFEWNVTRGLHSADGVLRETYLVNGVFPGPAIEANEGDTLLVRLRNTITPAHTKSNNSPGSVSEPDEDEGESGLSLSSAQFLEVHPPGTEDKLSIHWHGLSMRDSVGMDGSSGLTQCGVTPGKEITYRFRLSREDVGTHWWHSHIGTQRVDGLWGALIVHARNKWDQTALSAWKAKEAKSPAAKSGAAAAIRGKLDWSMEMVVAVGDHYHRTGSEVLAWYMSTYSLGFEVSGKDSSSPIIVFVRLLNDPSFS